MAQRLPSHLRGANPAMTPGDPVYNRRGIEAWLGGGSVTPGPAVEQHHGFRAAGPSSRIGGRESPPDGHGAASSRHGHPDVHHNEGDVAPKVNVQEVSSDTHSHRNSPERAQREQRVKAIVAQGLEGGSTRNGLAQGFRRLRNAGKDPKSQAYVDVDNDRHTHQEPTKSGLGSLVKKPFGGMFTKKTAKPPGTPRNNGNRPGKRSFFSKRKVAIDNTRLSPVPSDYRSSPALSEDNHTAAQPF